MTEPHCTGCGSGGLVDVFELRDQPVFVGVLHPDPGSARQAPRGDVVLAWCARSGLRHNRTFDPDRVDYCPGYEISLHHSRVFREFLASVAERLVARYELGGGTVLEIGCGAGHFLREMGARGIARGIGVDPSVPMEGREEEGGVEYLWIRDYFHPDRRLDLDADLIACLSAFEHIPDPGSFLAGLARRLAPGGTPVYFETFNALRALAADETWSVHYEACNYFGPDSLAALFARSGFEILDHGTCYEGDQYVYVEARPAVRPGRADGNRGVAALPPELADFSARYVSRRDAWDTRLDHIASRGERAILWGSGAKGIGFLNGVPAPERIPFVVDINPDRQGRFVPGTGHRIVAPEGLRDDPPDLVILSNPLYEREIRDQVAALGIACEFEAL